MAIPNGRAGKGIYRGPRFNKKPVVIGGVLVVMFFMGLFYAGQKRNGGVLKEEVASTEIYKIDATPESTIDFLADKPDGLVGVNRNDIGDIPEEYSNRQSLEDTLAELLEKQRIDAFRQDSERRARYETAQIAAYEEAIQSDTKVSGFGAGNTVFEARKRKLEKLAELDAQSNPDVLIPASAYGRPPATKTSQNQLDSAQIDTLMSSPQGQQLMAALGISRSGDGDRSSTDESGITRSNQFIGNADKKKAFTLYEEETSPRSPYEIKTGTLIPGAMISATNSNLPGDIVAQVTQNVYDTASGRFILIPQGTKLFGRYDAYVALGQERLVIVWDRLIFPDSETLDIEGMQGYDDRGLSGFTDKVKTHFFRTLANAFLISVVNAAGEELVNQASEKSDAGITINLAQDFRDNTSTAFNEYLRNRLRIKPTLEIRAGYRFNIVVSKDINFKRPYERGFRSYNSALRQ